MRRFLLIGLFLLATLSVYSDDVWVGGFKYSEQEIEAFYGMPEPATSSSLTCRLYFNSTNKRWMISEDGGNYTAILNQASADSLYLWLSGGNANQDIDISSSYNFSAKDMVLYDFSGGNETIDEILDDTLNRGLLDQVTVTDQGGLNITWSTGEVWDYANSKVVDTNAQASNQTCTDNDINYLIWASGVNLTLGTIAATGDQVQVAIISCQAGDIWDSHEESLVNQREGNIEQGLAEIFPVIVATGLIVSEHAGDNTWDIDMTAGVYYHDAHARHAPDAFDSNVTDMTRWYKSNNVWTFDSDDEIDITQYVSGGNLTGVSAPKYYASMFFVMDEDVHWVYPDTQHDTVAQAIAGGGPTLPPGLENFPKSTCVVIKGNAAGFPSAGGDQWIDVRPIIGITGIGIISDHGELAGLGDDDHTQYWADTTIGIRAKDYSTTGNISITTDNSTISLGSTGVMKIYVDGAGETYFNSTTVNMPVHFLYNDYGTINEAIGIYGSGGTGKPRVRIGAGASNANAVLLTKGIASTDGLRVVDNTNDAQWGEFMQSGGSTFIESVGNIYMRPSQGYVGWFGATNAFSIYRDKRFHFSEAGGSGCAFLYDNLNQDTNIPTFRLLMDDHTTGLEDKTRIFLITDYGDLIYSFGHQPQPDPTIIIHSGQRSQDEWISFAHNKTDGVIATGTGAINFNPGNDFDDYLSVNTTANQTTLNFVGQDGKVTADGGDINFTSMNLTTTGTITGGTLTDGTNTLTAGGVTFGVAVDYGAAGFPGANYCFPTIAPPPPGPPAGAGIADGEAQWDSATANAALGTAGTLWIWNAIGGAWEAH